MMYVPDTCAGVSMWLKSAATPGVCAISYKESFVTPGVCLRSKERGCPIPPLAPRTATLLLTCNEKITVFIKVQSSTVVFFPRTVQYI